MGLFCRRERQPLINMRVVQVPSDLADEAEKWNVDVEDAVDRFMERLRRKFS